MTTLMTRIEDRLEKLDVEDGDLLVFTGGDIPKETFQYIRDWAVRNDLEDILIVCIPEGQGFEALNRDELRERLDL